MYLNSNVDDSAVLYTSSITNVVDGKLDTTGVNCSLLKDYILHRLYGGGPFITAPVSIDIRDSIFMYALIFSFKCYVY